jgi:hypothetical protein
VTLKFYINISTRSRRYISFEIEDIIKLIRNLNHAFTDEHDSFRVGCIV